MARKKKKLTRRERRLRRQQKQKTEQILVEDTAATFTCTTNTARDLAYQCESRADDLDTDLIFTRLALSLWKGRPEAKDLVEAALDLEAETVRHVAALDALRERFHSLLERNEHHHLDPTEAYHDHVRRWIFPERPATTVSLPEVTSPPSPPEPLDRQISTD